MVVPTPPAVPATSTSVVSVVIMSRPRSAAVRHRSGPGPRPRHPGVTGAAPGPVDFDGFLRRGDPPVEVYQEVKGDYSFIDKFKNPEPMWSKQLQKFVDQAERQRTAIGPDAELEWIFTRNPELVELVEDLFADQGIDVTVRYVPYVR